MFIFKLLCCLALPFLLLACAGEAPLLRVDDFKLKGTELADKDAAMVRGDQNYVLFGKVSAEEREQAKGHYLMIRRRDAERPATFRVRYMQVATGSEKLLKEKRLAAGESVYEFRVTGDEYLQKGRILAWRVELEEEGKVIAAKQSYMW